MSTPKEKPSTFECYKCKKRSLYINRYTTEFMEMLVMERMDEDETRTYKCSECGMPNEITMKKMYWGHITHASG